MSPLRLPIKPVDVMELLGVKPQGADGGYRWLPLGHKPLPHQLPPERWDWLWLLQAGRGSGKTEAGANAALRHLWELGPRARVGVGAPTIADARDVCAEGETGLITLAKSQFRYNRSLGEAWHEAGGYVKFLGSEEPGRWNGPQWTFLWCDELALWVEESWHQAQFGLRLGPTPRVVATTTPKNRHFVKALAVHPGTALVRATTWDNPYLSSLVKARLQERYGETRLGRQELLAEFVDDVEGALWLRSWIEDSRIALATYETIGARRIVVAIDPAVTSQETSDETGIVVAAQGTDGQYYVLAAQGYRLSPHGWGQKAIDFYDAWKADKILAETNNGGQMVVDTIRAVRADVPVKTVVASRGKVLRAEPVAALFEQGKVHHAGIFPSLEDQMVSFPVANEHDDLVDALVYALTELSQAGIGWRPI